MQDHEVQAGTSVPGSPGLDTASADSWPSCPCFPVAGYSRSLVAFHSVIWVTAGSPASLGSAVQLTKSFQHGFGWKSLYCFFILEPTPNKGNRSWKLGKLGKEEHRSSLPVAWSWAAVSYASSTVLKKNLFLYSPFWFGCWRCVKQPGLKPGILPTLASQVCITWLHVLRFQVPHTYESRETMRRVQHCPGLHPLPLCWTLVLSSVELN